MPTGRICQTSYDTNGNAIGYSFMYQANPRGASKSYDARGQTRTLNKSDFIFNVNSYAAAAQNTNQLILLGQNCSDDGLKVIVPEHMAIMNFTFPSHTINGNVQPIPFIICGANPEVTITCLEATDPAFYLGDGVVACAHAPGYRVFQGFEDITIVARTKIMVEGFGKLFRARGLTLVSEDTNCALHLKHMYGAYIEDVYIVNSLGDGLFSEECIAVNYANIACRGNVGRGIKIWGISSQFSTGNFAHIDSEGNTGYQLDLQYCKNSHFWGYAESTNRIRLNNCKDLAFYGEGLDFQNTATYTVDAYSYLQNPLIWPLTSTAYSPPRSTNPYGNGGTGIVVTVTNQYNLSVVWNNASSIYWVDLCPGWDFQQDHRYEISVTISAVSGGVGGIAGWIYQSSNGTVTDSAFFTANDTYVIKPFCVNGRTAQNRVFISGRDTGKFTVTLNYVKEITRA